VTKESLQAVIIDIIRGIAPDEDLNSIDAEKPLREQIDLDSMDFLDIVMELRVRYKIDVPESDYMALNTLKSTVDYLFPKMQNA